VGRHVTRNIDTGAIVSRVFQIYRDYAAVLLPVAAVVFLVELVFNILGTTGWGWAVAASAVGVIMSTLYTGMVVELVNDVRDGRMDHSVGSLFSSVTPVLLPLLAVSILAGIGIAIGFVLLIVPGLFLVTYWAVVAPAVVIEKRGVFEAFSRSWNLVKGNAWQVFLVILMFFLIFILIGLILGGIGAAIGDAGQVVLSYVGRLITAPLVALAAAVLYFQLREVKEGAVPPAETTMPGGFAPPEAPR